MKNTSIKKKAVAAIVLLSFFSATAAFAQPKSQEECVDAVNDCY